MDSLDQSKIYAVLDEHNVAKGFYNSVLHNKIPDNTIEIPEDKWKRHLSGIPQQYVDGEWKDYEPSIDEKIKGLKDELIRKINSTYERKIEEPIIYNDATFQADRATQDIIAKILAVSDTDFKTIWLDIDNNEHEFTYDDIKQLGAAIMLRNEEYFKQKVAMKKKVREAKSLEELQNFEIKFVYPVNDSDTSDTSSSDTSSSDTSSSDTSSSDTSSSDTSSSDTSSSDTSNSDTSS